MKRIGVIGVFASALLLLCGVASLVRADQGEESKENDVVRSIADTERWVKKVVNSGVKVALPYLMSTILETRLNGKCVGGLMKLMKGVMDIRDWAFKMVDALGKPSAGILEGTSTAMGDFDECLDVKVPKNIRSPPPLPYSKGDIDFEGQFCVVQIQFPEGIIKDAKGYQAGNRSNSELANSKTFLKTLVKIAPRADVADFRFGVCIPSTCSRDDLEAVLAEISRMVMFKITTMRCEVNKETEFLTEHIVILSIIGLIAVFAAVGTFTEMVIRLRRSQPTVDIMHDQGILVQSMLAFSLANNVRKLFDLTSWGSEQIRCIRGMKFISVCLYIVVWTYATPQDFHFLKYRSAFYFYKFMEEWWFTIFANASAGIDTLFFIAGLQITYRVWKKSDGVKVNFSVPKFILKWYLRTTLCQVIVICLFLCLPLIGNGPIWGDVVTPALKNCKERWWLHILALNNFWSTSNTCLPHMWFICSLTHLLFIGSIILFILSKWTTAGIFVNVILILGSSLAVAMVTLMNDLPPAPSFYFLSFINIKTIWDKLFIQAYDHISPFCLGIIFGFFLQKHPKIELRRTTVIIGWCSAVACNLAVLCGLYGYRHGETMQMALSAIYASTHRLAWSLGIAWIVFACAYGYGGFVDKILSWKLLIPLERVTILLYVLHPLIVFLHQGQLRERIYMAHLDQAMYATAYIVFTVAIAALCYVTCVVPFTFFETKLWNYFTGEPSQEIPKLKRKQSKPTIIDIGPTLTKSKITLYPKFRLEPNHETKSFQT